MGILIDRLRPYYKKEKLKGKKAILLLPAGTGPDDCYLTIQMFKRVFKTLRLEMLGTVCANAYDEGDVLNDEVAMKQIYELAKQVLPA